VIIGSLKDTETLSVKEKLLSLEELLGHGKKAWCRRFMGGDFAVFRLTPEKYHYNHVPAAGKVVDMYDINGAHHACIPAASIALASPYSMNRRTVTVIDTDVPGGTGVGMVGFIEVVALMIGRIRQCYSEIR
jgi:phosphatidylserine decarboxylase